MPIYEEKLISPFAVRFTQEHIRTTFRDGRSLEAAIAEIQEQPGTGDYDVILQFPFPAIEIIRYHAPSLEHTSKVLVSEIFGEVPAGDHWFTLDNRRLYCLQRAAAACWPRRAGIAVEILYASPGSVRRKCDTTTYGCSVAISHSTRDAPISRWDWRVEVQCCAGTTVARYCAVRGALDAILCDDAKPTVGALMDLPGECKSAVARLLDMQNARSETEVRSIIKVRPATPSTADEDASDKDASDSIEGSVAAMPQPWSLSKMMNSIAAARHGKEDSDLVWWAIQEINQQLYTAGNNGYVWIAHWNDTYFPRLGSLRAFLESRPDVFTVFPGKGKSYTVAPVSQPSSRNHSWHQRAWAQWRV